MITRAQWKARALAAEAELAQCEAELADTYDDLYVAEHDAAEYRAKYDDLVAQIVKAMQEQNPPPPPPPTPSRWFADSSPWNQKVTGKPIHPNSQRIVNQILDGLPGQVDAQGQPSRPTANVIRLTTGWDQWDYEHPVFFASASDPTKRIVGGACNGVTIRVPANAKPATSDDGHLAVVQPNGDTYEFWRATVSATTISCSWGDGPNNIWTGSGCSLYGGGATCTLGHFALGAGMIRPGEIATTIPHALFLVTYNYSGWQAPAQQGQQPYRYMVHPDVPKMGTRLRLDLTDQEIAALPAHLRPLATCCRDYGLIVGDTGGGGLHVTNADREAWKALGRTDWDLRPYVDMRTKLKVIQ